MRVVPNTTETPKRRRPVHQTRTVIRGDGTTSCIRCHALFHTKCLVAQLKGEPVPVPYECVECIRGDTVEPRLTAVPVVQWDDGESTEDDETVPPHKRPPAAKHQTKRAPPIKRRKVDPPCVEPLGATSAAPPPQTRVPWSSDEIAMLLKAVRMLPSVPRPTASQVADLYNTVAHQQQRPGREVDDVATQAAQRGLELLASEDDAATSDRHDCGHATTGLPGGSLTEVIEAVVQADRRLRK